MIAGHSGSPSTSLCPSTDTSTETLISIASLCFGVWGPPLGPIPLVPSSSRLESREDFSLLRPRGGGCLGIQVGFQGPVGGTGRGNRSKGIRVGVSERVGFHPVLPPPVFFCPAAPSLFLLWTRRRTRTHAILILLFPPPLLQGFFSAGGSSRSAGGWFIESPFRIFSS